MTLTRLYNFVLIADFIVYARPLHGLGTRHLYGVYAWIRRLFERTKVAYERLTGIHLVF